MQTRPEQIPIIEEKRIVGYRNGSNLVDVFHLLGWGETQETAEEMAMRVLALEEAKRKLRHELV